MNAERALDIEECIARLSVNFGKLSYLINAVSQKLEKNTDALTMQEKETFIYERDNLRTSIDIVEDYLREASDILNELREWLLNELAQDTACSSRRSQ